MDDKIKVLRFDLSGDFAFFKKPDVNSELSFTYGQIHKVALLGILGACLGFGGYLEQGEEVYPEFYSKLKDLKISIVPKNENAQITKFLHAFNNSTGNASKEEGGNLIVKEQWLNNPMWGIYIKLDDDKLSKDLERVFTNLEFEYIPYLGKNDFIADIYNVEILELEKIEQANKINSIFIAKDFEVVNTSTTRRRRGGENTGMEYLYSENLPVGLTDLTNHYILEKFNATNKSIKSLNPENPIFKDLKNDITVTFL